MPEGSAKPLWEKVYNASVKAGDSKETAAKKAWSAIKSAGWHKNADGEWVKGKGEFAELSMSIIRASWDKETQQMRWRSVNSDTGPDVFTESMSEELFDDFVSRIENDSEVPAPFDAVVCEDDWCGGMPYLSISHYKSGTGRKNVPGEIESVYRDGNRLKSTGTFYNNPLGKAAFDSINRDLYKKKADGSPEVPAEERVRISIGFLDLEHKHVMDDGAEEVFTRKDLGKNCRLCEEGIGRKIYLKGQLVHLALTRVPANPRTLMEVDKAMSIKTRKEDAASIVGEELLEDIETKSLADDVLVIKSDDMLLDDEVRAVREAFYSSHGTSAGMPASLYVPGVGKGFLIAEHSGMLFKVPYTESDGGYSFAEPMKWQKVREQKKYIPVKSDAEDEDSLPVTKSESWGEEPASSYLVVEDPKKSATWHLPVKRNGTLDHELLVAARTALTSSQAEKSYAGPDKARALLSLKRLYAVQKMEWKSEVEETMSGKTLTAEEIKNAETVDETVTAPAAAPATPAAPAAEAAAAAPVAPAAPAEDVLDPALSRLVDKFAPLGQKVLELRDAGISGKDAAASLQPLLNEMAAEIENTLSAPVSGGSSEMLAEIHRMVKASNALIESQGRDLAVLKSRVDALKGTAPEKSDAPRSRALTVRTGAQNVQGGQAAPAAPQLTQIQKLAYRSVGIPMQDES